MCGIKTYSEMAAESQTKKNITVFPIPFIFNGYNNIKKCWFFFAARPTGHRAWNWLRQTKKMIMIGQ